MKFGAMFSPSPFAQPSLGVGALPKYFAHALFLGLLLIAAWEYLGLDVPLARMSYNAASQSFEWRHHWLLTTVLHSAIKNVLVCGVLCVLLAAVLPQKLRVRFLGLRALPRGANAMLFIMLVTPAALVSLLKSQSLPFCPWDEALFGGAAPQHQWWQPLIETVAGKFGRCWPAGHASAGFGLFALYFFARLYAPHFAFKALGFALAVGLIMGIAQQIRGAHFMSHTLWTAWLAWAVCGLLAPLLRHVTLRAEHKAG